MKRLARVLLLLLAGSCSGQSRIVQEDADRGIVLRYTNIETIGCFGERGVGGTAGSLRLEVSEPPGFYGVPTPERCFDSVSFDASVDPIQITCAGRKYALYRLAASQSVLGPEGEFRPLHEAAEVLVARRGRSILKALLTEAHARGRMVETLIALADTDCGQYWDVSFEGLSTGEQQRVREGLRVRPGESVLRTRRLKRSG